jgi:hypothetical protein
MISNEEMKAVRYGRWAAARELYAKIQDTLNAGGIVMMSTYTKHTQYEKKHIDMFRCTKDGVYVQRGKSWDCISGCGFRFYRPAVKEAA